MPEETVTLSVAALRELLKRGESMCIWMNLPYTSERNYHRTIQIRESRRTNDDLELSVEYQENHSTVRQVTVSISEIFNLAEQIRAIVAERATGAVKQLQILQRSLEALKRHDQEYEYDTPPTLISDLEAAIHGEA